MTTGELLSTRAALAHALQVQLLCLPLEVVAVLDECVDEVIETNFPPRIAKRLRRATREGASPDLDFLMGYVKAIALAQVADRILAPSREAIVLDSGAEARIRTVISDSFREALEDGLREGMAPLDEFLNSFRHATSLIAETAGRLREKRGDGVGK